MAALRYAIAPSIFEQHPGYVRGVLVFGAVRNGTGNTVVAERLRAAEAAARQAVPANVAELPQLDAWRAAYRRFGAKPSEHRSSIEALLRRVLKPDELPAINTLVDIGNAVSLRHLLPAGVHPLPHDVGALELRPAVPGDDFRPSELGAAEPVPPGEIVLVAGHEVLTRRWTWRQSWLTRTLPETTKVFFNLDGLPPTGVDTIHAAMREVIEWVSELCGGTLLARAVIDAGCPEVLLPA